MTRIRMMVLAVAAATAPAAMAGTVYSSLSAWTGSSPGNLNVVDFESLSPGYYSSLTVSPFTFGTTGLLVLQNGAAAGTGSGHYLTTDLAPTMTISLATGVYGIAFNLGSNQTASQTATIVAVDVNGVHYTTSSFATSGAVNPAAFWGLRNDIQLVSVTITFTSGIQPQLDNVRYSNTILVAGPPTPEPASFGLMLGGLGALLLLRNAKNHRRQASKRGLQLAGVG